MTYKITAYESDGIDEEYREKIEELSQDTDSIYHDRIAEMVGFVDVTGTGSDWPEDSDLLTSAKRRCGENVLVDSEPYADNQGCESGDDGWARYAIIPSA